MLVSADAQDERREYVRLQLLVENRGLANKFRTVSPIEQRIAAFKRQTSNCSCRSLDLANLRVKQTTILCDVGPYSLMLAPPLGGVFGIGADRP